MPAALRTLVHPRRARVQAASHACLATFRLKFLSSSASTCKHNAALHSGSPCGRRAAKLLCSQAPLLCQCKQQEHGQSSHIHSGEASNFSPQDPDRRPGLDLVGLTDHQHHAVQPTCDGDACDSKVRDTLVSQRKPRSKKQRKLESPESWHRQVSVIESCKQVLPVNATALEKPRNLDATSPEHVAAVPKVLEEYLGSSERASQALATGLGVLNQRSELLEQKLMVLAHFATRDKVFKKVCTVPHVLSQELVLLHNILHVFEEIGLTAKARNKILWVQPSISWAKGMTLLHASDFFKCLGMHGREVSRLPEKQATLFLHSVHSLMGYYTFFRQLGFSVQEFTRIALAGFPTLAIRTLEARVKLLKDQGFSDGEVHLLIMRKPKILALTCAYLKKKLTFLLCEQSYDSADIVRCPACLTFSLQDRLIPRLTAVQERGLFKVYSLSTILFCKDAVFQSRLRNKGKCR